MNKPKNIKIAKREIPIWVDLFSPCSDLGLRPLSFVAPLEKTSIIFITSQKKTTDAITIAKTPIVPSIDPPTKSPKFI
jgi:hypothetical protein